MTLTGLQIVDTLMIKHQFQVINSIDDLNTICMTLLQDMVNAELSDPLVVFDSDDAIIEVSFLDEVTGQECMVEYKLTLSDDFNVDVDKFGKELPDA